MNRYLAVPPTNYDMSRMRLVTRTRFPAALDVNEVLDAGITKIALYLNSDPGAAALSAWQAGITAATTPYVDPDQAVQADLLTKIRAAVQANIALQNQADVTFSNISQAQTAVNNLLHAVQAMSKRQNAVLKYLIGDFADTTGT